MFKKIVIQMDKKTQIELITAAKTHKITTRV